MYQPGKQHTVPRNAASGRAPGAGRGPRLHPDSRRQGQQRGTTMIESLVVLASTVLALTSALPSWRDLRQLQHLEGTALQFETDVQFTRSMAVAQRRNLRMSFFSESHGSCYVVHVGAAGVCRCDASGQALCSDGQAPMRVQHYRSQHPVTVQSNVSSIVFAGDLGTSTPAGTVRFQTTPTDAIHAVINVMGRVRHCTPSQSRVVRGYSIC